MAAAVAAVYKSIKDLSNKRMAYRVAKGIGLQIAFGDIGLIIGIVYQYVIPGLILGRLGTGDLLIPLLTALKYRIDVNNNAAVIKELVLDQLSDVKLSALAFHSRSS